jgi:hypothetical protein
MLQVSALENVPGPAGDLTLLVGDLIVRKESQEFGCVHVWCKQVVSASKENSICPAVGTPLPGGEATAENDLQRLETSKRPAELNSRVTRARLASVFIRTSGSTD